MGPEGAHHSIGVLKTTMERLLNEKCKVSEKEAKISCLDRLFDSCYEYLKSGEADEIYSLFEFSKDLFHAAFKEADDNEAKFEKCSKNGKPPKLKAKVFDIAIKLLLESSRISIDNSTVPWVYFSVKMIQKRWVKADTYAEGQLSSAIASCCSHSRLVWVDHASIKNLWIRLWQRFEDKSYPFDSNALRSYVDAALEILQSVDLKIFEDSATSLMANVTAKMFAVAPQSRASIWSQSVIHSYTSLFMFLTSRWGVSGRTTVSSRILPFACEMTSHLTVDRLNSLSFHAYLWVLVDDIVKLSVPHLEARRDNLKSPLLFDPDCIPLLKSAINYSLKSLHTICSNRATFTFEQDQSEMIAKWLTAQETLSTVFDLTQSQPSFYLESNNEEVITIHNLANLEFGVGLQRANQRNLAYSCSLQILEKAVLSGKLSNKSLDRLLVTLWSQRCKISTDALRFSFCKVLSAFVYKGVLLHGETKLPSATDVFRFGLASTYAECSLASAIELLTQVLLTSARKLSFERPIGELICDILLRTTAESVFPVKLLSAFLATCEFDENRQFFPADFGDSGPCEWRLRKQMIRWMLMNPALHSVNVLLQACYYHSIYAFLPEKCQPKGELSQTLQRLQLLGADEMDKKSNTNLEMLRIPINGVAQYALNALEELLGKDEEPSCTSIIWTLVNNFTLEFNFGEDLRNKWSKRLSKKQFELEEADFAECLEILTSTTELRFLSLDDLSPNLQAAVLAAFVVTDNFNRCDFPESLGVLQCLLEKAEKNDKLREKLKDCTDFGRLVEKCIQVDFFSDFSSDVYEIVARVEQFEKILSGVSLARIGSTIMHEVERNLEEERIDCGDYNVIKKRLLHCRIRQADGKMVVDFDGADVDVAAMYAENIRLDLRTVKQIFSSSKSALFTQKVVATALLNPSMWRIHACVLKLVVKNRTQYEVCRETIPNLDAFIRYYDAAIESEMLPLLTWKRGAKKEDFSESFLKYFGVGIKKWRKASSLFWSYFDRCPHLMIDKLWEFATESIELRLVERLMMFLRALLNCEGAQRFVRSTEYNTVLCLVYNAIFRMAYDSCAADQKLGSNGQVTVEELMSYCWDGNLKLDILKNVYQQKNDVWSEDAEFLAFESAASLAVESFLSRHEMDLVNLGYAEFYKILFVEVAGTTITGDARWRILDVLADAWRLQPHMRSHIVPILARFRHSALLTPLPYAAHAKFSMDAFEKRLKRISAMKLLDPRRAQSGGKSIWASLYLNLSLATHLPSVTAKDVEKNAKFSSETSDFDEVGRLCSSLSRLQKLDIPPIVLKMIDLIGSCKELALLAAPALSYAAGSGRGYVSAIDGILQCCTSIQGKNRPREVVACLAECIDAVGLDMWATNEGRYDDVCNIGSMCLLAKILHEAGYNSHAYAIANLCFDKQVLNIRGVFIVEQKEWIDDRLTDVLKNIYLSEGSHSSLSTLPHHVQTEEAVQTLKWKKTNEWIRVASSKSASPVERNFARWLCGLPTDGTTEAQFYRNAFYRADFASLYPKQLDDTWKTIYAMIFHVASDASPQSLESIIDFCRSLFVENLAASTDVCEQIDMFRLLSVAWGSKDYDLETIDEKLVSTMRRIQSVRKVKDVKTRIKQAAYFNRVGEDVQKFSDSLVQLKGHSAALALFDIWTSMCKEWKADDADVDEFAVVIAACNIMIEIGDSANAEAKLLDVKTQFNDLSPSNRVDLSLSLAKVASDGRNNLRLSITILEKMNQRLASASSPELKLRLQLSLHEYALNELSKLEEYKESRSFRMRNDAVKAFDRQLGNRDSRLSMGREEESRRAEHRVLKESQCARDEIVKTETAIGQLAFSTVQSGLEALVAMRALSVEEGDLRSSLILFPLIDVIFKYENNLKIVNTFKEYAANEMESRFWLLAASHIASRYFSSNSKHSSMRTLFCKILQRLILDYPYHALNVVFMYEPTRFSVVNDFLKSTIALCPASKRAKLSAVLKRMRAAHEAYRQLVEWDLSVDGVERVKADGKVLYMLPKKLGIFSCDLDQLPIPVIRQPVGQPGIYEPDELITWKSWKPYCIKADGLSAPKILDVEGSDGVWYKIVWKKEDVRQDFLVEQMFEVMNLVLGNKSDSPSYLRTYNVLPLDLKCGAIEFCGGTVSLKELLCGTDKSSGLHADFRKEEPLASKVSHDMKAVQKCSTEEKRSKFIEICRDFTPVFRHFFYSNYPNVYLWRERIEDYCKSLAAWSIVCYVVGLGDRHASNILFEMESARFVHIDLGMIFEYSKRTLPVPEQVPFRLTRDVLDPLLLEGVKNNGQLICAAVDTMDVIKKNSKVILGLASALLRETMSNFREAEETVGRPSYISEMAIGRLREKLEGTDNGVTPQMSSVQVRRLFTNAYNVDNLSRMFCGWMPFL